MEIVVLDLGRREVVRVRVTSAPSALYAAQSFVEAVCDRDDQAPRFLVHGRDSIYGKWLPRRLKNLRPPVKARRGCSRRSP